MQLWRLEFELDGINLGVGTIAYQISIHKQLFYGPLGFCPGLPGSTNKDISLIMRGRLYSSCV